MAAISQEENKLSDRFAACYSVCLLCGKLNHHFIIVTHSPPCDSLDNPLFLWLFFAYNIDIVIHHNIVDDAELTAHVNRIVVCLFFWKIYLLTFSAGDAGEESKKKKFITKFSRQRVIRVKVKIKVEFPLWLDLIWYIFLKLNYSRSLGRVVVCRFWQSEEMKKKKCSLSDCQTRAAQCEKLAVIVNHYKLLMTLSRALLCSRLSHRWLEHFYR